LVGRLCRDSVRLAGGDPRSSVLSSGVFFDGQSQGRSGWSSSLASAKPIGRGPGRRMGFQKEEGKEKRKKPAPGGVDFSTFFFGGVCVGPVLFWRKTKFLRFGRNEVLFHSMSRGVCVLDPSPARPARFTETESEKTSQSFPHIGMLASQFSTWPYRRPVSSERSDRSKSLIASADPVFFFAFVAVDSGLVRWKEGGYQDQAMVQGRWTRVQDPR
jgi:hypothetical protein